MSGLEEVDISDIAPSAKSREDAVDQEYRWTWLVWSEPGKGKTHFAHTMPEPVMYIDTEGKGDNIAHKFEDKVIQYWQPENYDEALEAVAQALDALDKYKEEADVLGTLVIDSMSIMWEWAQQKYVDEFYPGKDSEDVEFSTGFGSGNSDWKKIKDYHNAKFRDILVNSDYHLCWTAMADDDYSAAIEDGLQIQKPSGEKNNKFKVNNILHIYEAGDTIPHGELDKSDLTKYHFEGLKRPTFEKVSSVVNTLSEAEVEKSQTGESIDLSERLDYPVKNITEGNPRIQRAKRKASE